MYNFKYHKVNTIQEAVSLLSSCEDPKILAGGHTLIPTLKQRLSQPSDIIDISTIKDLSSISIQNNKLMIGALCTHNDVSSSPDVISTIDGLSELAKKIGDPQVRHRGTIGGSVANADPAADYPAALVALKAVIHTSKSTYQAEKFFIDMFQTAIETDEIIRGIEFEIPITSSYKKFKNPASGYAMAGVFIAKFDNDIRVAVTGASSVVFRLREVEEALTNKFNISSIENISIDSSNFNDDIHASSKYRGNLVKVLVEEAISDLI
ncbi:MAG: xanthine dehydrogenase family protein subunit M [Hyphomicrobiales bacterium]|jgi:carbon-monoxide dehydrogenase medium subunit|nr:xanthine dehydrogenase family protein subunit M [Hyphomicrobiales bacterium]|tara:strand:+ start:9 stop:803 length:795 start_codon:yes stop_codon:yes gene_type:complete